jgi:phage/plasmid-associated DNA primase
VYEPRPQDEQMSPYVLINDRRYLNNWTGWASEPEPDPEGVAQYWTQLLDHLFQQQAYESEKQKNERVRARRWLEMWFAYPVQNPQAKLYSCAVLLGAQGGGKTLLGSMVGWACYGRHFTEITQDQLDSRFNASWAANRSFVMGSEVTSVADHKLQRRVSEILKNWITGDEVELERKGQDSYKVKNVINLYFTANKDNAFFLEDDDRRYFIHSIPDVKLADALGQAWVRGMDSYIRSPKGQAALHHHLLHNVTIDRQVFDPKGPPPDTEAKRNAKEYSQNAAEHWLDKFAEQPEEFLNTPRDEQVFRFEEVYQAFLRTAKSDSMRWSEQAFIRIFRTRFRTLGRALIPVFDKRVRCRDKSGNSIWRDVHKTRKNGLWIRNPNFNSADARYFVTIAEAAKMWKEQLKRRAAHDPA